jgi:hypothetical protein
MAIEAWRKGAEPQLRRKRCDDAAADAALGRNTDMTIRRNVIPL